MIVDFVDSTNYIDIDEINELKKVHGLFYL